MAYEAPIYALPAHIENWATGLAAMGAAGSLAYCLRHAVKTKSPLALYLFAGGALTCLVEPFIDTQGHAIFAQADRISWTSTFGRHIPAYIGLILMFYVAPAYLALIELMRKGVTPKQWRNLCAAIVVSTVAFEVVPMHYDLWRYYGPQGIQVGQVPIWWGFTNGGGLIGTAVLLFLLLKLIPANRQFILVPLMPALFLGVHTAGSVFAYMGLNSADTKAAAYLGTAATCVLCSTFFWLYAKVVCRPADAASPAGTPGAALTRA